MPLKKLKLSFSYFSLLPLLAFVAILGLDRWTKDWALSWPEGHIINIAPYVDFLLVKNRGIAFGLLADTDINFLIISLISLVLLYLVFRFFLPSFPLWPFVLIASGALGNIIDRWMYGFVVDFIKVHQFYVFNVADAAITIGSAILIFQLLFKKTFHESPQG